MSTESKKADIREYQIRTGLTDTFGRLICNSRHHHFVVDGPAQNGCPGEALTPPEIFLAGVITCGVELVQVFARDKNLSLRFATGIISATLDANSQPNDHRLISAVQATLREVLILCDDGCLLLNRVPPDFGVAGLSESDLTHGESIHSRLHATAARRQAAAEHRQRISRHLKDRMVGLSRGVLEARLDIFSF